MRLLKTVTVKEKKIETEVDKTRPVKPKATGK